MGKSPAEVLRQVSAGESGWDPRTAEEGKSWCIEESTLRFYAVLSLLLCRLIIIQETLTNY